MAEKEKEMPLKHLDRRVVERYLKKGVIDEKEYQKYLKSLEDLSTEASSLETELTPGGHLGPSR